MNDQGGERAVRRPELIFAITGPLGARLDNLASELKAALVTFGYTAVDIRLSQLLRRFSTWTEPEAPTEQVRLKHLQFVANVTRGEHEDGAVIVRAAVDEVRHIRAAISGSPDEPATNHAFILYQLKHPDEVALLRETYGEAFQLVAGHAARAVRLVDLAKQLAASADQPGQEERFQAPSLDLVLEDQKSDLEFGQNVRDTYPLADYFVDLNVQGGQYAVRRFADLLFGDPLSTPSPEEYAMFQASAVALRSSDLNRQVGAAIVDLVCDHNNKVTNADVLAVGMNEVPRGGGGFYWDQASPDRRDQALTEDRARDIKVSALAEMLERMRDQRWLGEAAGNGDSSELARKLLPHLSKTQFMNIGEFSRPVHAEMAAILDAARRGISIDGHTMLVTTFPCHNCAKHIIAAGIKRVIYLEPYPKSRAGHLYGEELNLDAADPRIVEDKVTFVAYSGVAPRQYRTLFSMAERGAKQGLTRTQWQQSRASRPPLYVSPYLFKRYASAEAAIVEGLAALGYVRDQ